MSTCVFIQIRCKPGTTYKVAEEIALLEIHSELYSTSGDFDLMMKRQRTFLSEEDAARRRFLETHECRATEGVEVS